MDGAQWMRAKQGYRGMRYSLRLIKEKFPPRTAGESGMFQKYTIFIQQFGQELLKPRDRIDVKKLNKLSDDAAQAYVSYFDGYDL
jgi:hypothetical protein